MSDSAELYYAAQAALIHLEKAGTATETVTERIRERMDLLWREMSDVERAQARKLAAEELRRGPSDV